MLGVTSGGLGHGKEWIIATKIGTGIGMSGVGRGLRRDNHSSSRIGTANVVLEEQEEEVVGTHHPNNNSTTAMGIDGESDTDRGPAKETRDGIGPRKS